MTLLNRNPCNRATVQSKRGWGGVSIIPMCVVTSDSTNQTKSIRCRHMPSHASCFASENFPKKASSASPALPSDAILEKNHGSNDRSPAVEGWSSSSSSSSPRSSKAATPTAKLGPSADPNCTWPIYGSKCGEEN